MTLIAIKVQGKLVVAIAPIGLRADGSIVPDATDAELNACAARIEETGGRDNIGQWVDPNDEVFWVAAVKPRTYKVELVMSYQPGSDGDQFVVQVGGASLRGTTKATKRRGQSEDRTVGAVPRVGEAGGHVEARPDEPARGAARSDSPDALNLPTSPPPLPSE